MNEQNIEPKNGAAKIPVHFIVIFLFCLLLFYGCDLPKMEPDPITGRFDMIEDFYPFDGSPNEQKGGIIRDRVTGGCFMYVWFGAANGGAGLAQVNNDLCTR